MVWLLCSVIDAFQCFCSNTDQGWNNRSLTQAQGTKTSRQRTGTQSQMTSRHLIAEVRRNDKGNWDPLKAKRRRELKTRGERQERLTRTYFLGIKHSKFSIISRIHDVSHMCPFLWGRPDFKFFYSLYRRNYCMRIGNWKSIKRKRFLTKSYM